MSEAEAKSLIDRVDYALFWTLRGGNDPNDRGDVKDAVERLGTIIIELIKSMPKERTQS